MFINADDCVRCADCSALPKKDKNGNLYCPECGADAYTGRDGVYNHSTSDSHNYSKSPIGAEALTDAERNGGSVWL